MAKQTRTQGGKRPSDSYDGETDVEGFLNDYEKRQATQGIFKPKGEGEFKIRILPPKTVQGEKRFFYVPFGVHFNIEQIAPNSGDRRSVRCLKRTLDQDCPVCAVNRKRFQAARRPNGSQDQAILDQAKATRSKERFVCNIVNMDDQKEGVLTWEFGPEVLGMLVSIFKEWGNITHPTEGHVLKVKYVDKGDFGAVVGSITPLKDQTPPPKGWQAGRKDLDAYAQTDLLNKKQLLDLFKEPEDDLDEDEDNDESDDSEDPMEVAGDDGDEESESEESEEESESEESEEESESEESEEDEPSDADLLQDPEVQKVLAKIKAGGKKK